MKITDTKHRLKELLNETGDTQNEMARKSGLTKSAISNYLNGTREPRQDAIYKISVAYNVSPTWLMGLDVDKISEIGNIEIVIKKRRANTHAFYSFFTQYLLENYSLLIFALTLPDNVVTFLVETNIASAI